MQKEFRIDPQQLDTYVSRETKKRMKKVAIIMALVVLAFLMFFLFAGGIEVLTLIGPVFLLIMPLIFGILFLTQPMHIKEQAKVTMFIISENEVVRLMNINDMNALAKFGARRAQSRYGEKFNRFVNKVDFDTIDFKEDEVVVRSRNYNIFNESGEVVIPKEIKGYDEAVSLLREHYS